MLDSWLFWAVAASFFWGVGGIFVKKSLASVTPLFYNVLVTVVGLFVYIPYAIYLGFNLEKMSWPAFLALAFVAATYLLYFYTISMESVSLVGTVLATYPLATVIFSIVFLGERISSSQIFFGLVILFGVVLIGLPEKVRELKLKKWFVFAFGVSLVVGFADFVAKGVVNRTAMGDYFMMYALGTLPGIMVAYGLDKKGRVWPTVSGAAWGWVLLGALFMELGNVSFFTAFSHGPASLVSPFVSSYQAITVVLAFIFLKERLTKVQAVGVGLAAAGIIFLGA